MLTQFLPFALVFGVVYLFVIRPQRRRAQAHQAMLEALRRGDMVATSSGLVGKVDWLDGDEVGLELAPGVVVKMLKRAVSEVRSKSVAEGAAKKKDKKGGGRKDRDADRPDSAVASAGGVAG